MRAHCAGRGDCNLQRRFPFDDILFRSGDIGARSKLWSHPKFAPTFGVFGPPNSWGDLSPDFWPNFRPVVRGGFWGLKPPPPPPPRKVCTINFVFTFLLKGWACAAWECCCDTIYFHRLPECIKMHHFKGENTKIFLRRGHSSLPRHHPHWGGGTSPPSAPPFLEPTSNQISGYGPA